jgi:hypothetical protein
MSRKDQIKSAFVDILGPLFLGSDKEQKRATESVAEDVAEQIRRRKRRLNAIDVEGEEVKDE